VTFSKISAKNRPGLSGSAFFYAFSPVNNRGFRKDFSNLGVFQEALCFVLVSIVIPVLTIDYGFSKLVTVLLAAPESVESERGRAKKSLSLRKIIIDREVANLVYIRSSTFIRIEPVGAISFGFSNRGGCVLH